MLKVEIHKRLAGFTLDVAFETDRAPLALLGASGSGKSMTLRCIAGVTTPDRGHVELDGRTLFDSRRRVNLPPQQRDTGLLFQGGALFPNMTVADNVALGARRAAGRAGRAAIVDELLKKFDLEAQRGHYPAQLSGGQRQRAALARILAGKPAVLMLDEPLTALDGHLRGRVERELLRVIESFDGETIYVSHDRGEAYRLCGPGSVCVIDRGRSVETAPTPAFFSRPRTRAGALLAGVENFSEARLLGDGRALAVDWDWEVTVGDGAGDTVGDGGGTWFVGIRSRDLAAGEPRNRRAFRVERVAPDQFTTIALLDHDLRAEFVAGTTGPRPGERVELGVDPDRVLLVRG